jgi:phage tail-like protein
MAGDQPERPPEAQARATTGHRSEPLIGAGFRVEIDGVVDAAAVEVILAEARIAGEREQRIVQYAPLTLRRALTGAPDWYQWWDRARRSPAGGVNRVVRVILVDRSRADIAVWTYPNAKPTAYSVSPLNALANAPIVETLELSVDGFEAEFDPSRSQRARPRPGVVAPEHGTT